MAKAKKYPAPATFELDPKKHVAAPALVGKKHHKNGVDGYLA